MQKFYLLLFILTLTGFKCTKKIPKSEPALINTAHLDHLYQEIEIDSLKLGTIWIYSDAPDYNLVTDQDEGFTCVDDVSRALVFYCRQYKVNPLQKYLDKIKSLSRFIMYMRAPNGYYYNFMFTDKQINKVHQNSKPTPNFWSWRAYWALSELSLVDGDGLQEIQAEARNQLSSLTQKIDLLFQQPDELITIEGLTISKRMADFGGDQMSVILLGLTNYYRINPNETIKNLMQNIGESILSAQFGNKKTFPYGAFLSWKNIWHAWGNTQAYALLKAGNELHNETFITSALKEVDNFFTYREEQLYLHQFSIKKVDDSIQMYDLQRFPQIAYNISPMILASIEAYNITKSEKYAVQAGQLSGWFFGKNAANRQMVNTETGVVFDGIDSDENVNTNSGAESTIEALLALQAIETAPEAMQILNANR